MFIFLGLFIFLFIIYVLSKEDFLFWRKNVSLEQVFNIVLTGLVFALLFGRLYFVITHWHAAYLNPLVFLLVPYFPGLSLPGGILGFLLFLLLALQTKKLPVGRIFDMSSLAFLAGSSAVLFVEQLIVLISRKHVDLFGILHFCFYLILFFLFLPIVRKNSIKEGVVGNIILAFYSLLPVLESLFQRKSSGGVFFREDGLYMILFAANVILLIGRSNAFKRK